MGSGLEILALGGVGRIGMNCMLVGCRNRWVIVDCGIGFAAEWEIGAEKKLVDLNRFQELAPHVEAVLITHGHEDHIGGLPFILPYLPDVPVFATPFTRQLIAHRLAEWNLWSPDRVTLYEAGDTFTAGPFEVEALRVTHSIPDCVALVMRSELGTVLHTGDWKIDRTPVDGDQFDDGAFERVGKEGVDLLLSDSTNVLREGWTRSEHAVGQALHRTIAPIQGRVVVTQFASNIHRVRSLVQVAEATGRQLAFAGGSLERYLRCASRVGRAPIDPGKVVRADQIGNMDPAKSLIITTGSQGERAAALLRSAEGTHPHLRINKDDTILHSARIIPGQEAHVFAMFNAIAYQGANLVYGRTTDIHASGHACKDELRHLISLVKPKAFIPVHGERTFLGAHAQLGRDLGVPSVMVMRNGERIGITNHGKRATLERLAYQPPTAFYSSGLAVADREGMRMTERKRLAWNGIIAVHVDVTHDGEASARVQMKAVVDPQGDLEAQLVSVAQRAALNVPAQTPTSEVEQAIKHSLRRTCRTLTGQKPAVMVFLNYLKAAS